MVISVNGSPVTLDMDSILLLILRLFSGRSYRRRAF